jgi:hypothetical protein
MKTIALFDEVLKRPAAALAGLGSPDWRGRAARLFAGSVAAIAFYGAVAGLFDGQALLALWKAPLIVLLATALCAPSLYVLSAIVGRDLELRVFAGALTGFLASLGILLVALLPIGWLFSVSSRSLVSVVWLHVVLGFLAIALAARFLGRLFTGYGGTLTLWVMLLLLVVLQATTVLRPVLSRAPGAPVFEGRKLFFFEHLGEIVRAEEAADEAARAAAAPPAK